MARLPLVSPLDRILFLKAQPYLVGQTPGVLTALASYTEDRFHAAGTVVRPASKRFDEILFLAEGAVEILEASARRIEAPGVIGIPHAATGATEAPEIHAAEDTLLLAIATADMDQILDDHSALLMNFSLRTAEQFLHVERSLGDQRPEIPAFSEEDGAGTPIELDLVHRLARARRAPFFAETNLSVLGQLIRYEEVRRIQPQEALWEIGDPIQEMTLVLDGSFESRGPFPVTNARAGAVIGAYDILSEGDREESWVARKPSRVLDISRNHFIDVFEDYPEFARAYHAYCARATLDAWDRAARLERLDVQTADHTT
ncbi:MAG: cyclic nucleotide-binding domain-containing protein [bacterium]|nr:cyclic nucleotide-binding domain-containing protein [bacterium]